MCSAEKCFSRTKRPTTFVSIPLFMDAKWFTSHGISVAQKKVMEYLSRNQVLLVQLEG